MNVGLPPSAINPVRYESVGALKTVITYSELSGMATPYTPDQLPDSISGRAAEFERVVAVDYEMANARNNGIPTGGGIAIAFFGVKSNESVVLL